MTIFILHSICNDNIHTIGPKHQDLHMGNWNNTSLNVKEQKLVWEEEQYHLDIVRVSSTKCRDFDTVELNEGCKLFYLGAVVTMSAQAGL